jgi:hypothetical protein
LYAQAPNQVGRFGAAVAEVPDVDGDGGFDIVVGEPYGRRLIDELNQAVGMVQLHAGSDGAFIREFLMPVPQSAAQFGFAVAGARDLDGDGLGDVIVGASLFLGH